MNYFKNRIGFKLLAGIFLIVVALSAGITVTVSTLFKNTVLGMYADWGEGITTSLSIAIDGDQAISHVNDPVIDDWYLELQEGVTRYRDRFGATHIYLAVPTDEGLVMICNAGELDEYIIGTIRPYSPGGYEWCMEEMEGESHYGLKVFKNKDYGELATVAETVKNSEGVPVALIFADFSLDNINHFVRSIIFIILFIVVTLTLLVSIIAYFYVKSTLVNPIKKLTNAAKKLTSNLDTDNAYVSDIHTGDELEELSKAYETMDSELRDYISENLKITAEKQRISTELDMAASIQENQLPNIFPPFPNRNEFDIFASMKPAKEVGGDFYDFFLVDEDHVALVMADVSGKGIPAALFMMISKILIKNRVQAGDSPAQALDNVNKQLLENNTSRHFVTVWLAVIELSTGKGIAGNAGHEHPILKRADGKYELVEYKHNPPLATFDLIKYREHEFELHCGDSLFVYTDGAPEATNKDGDFFGTDRMLDALNKEYDDGSTKKVCERISKAITQFVGEAEQFDDLTMLNFQYYGPSGKGGETVSP